MSEIDDLMNIDPLNLSAQNIDQIIAHQRKMSANYSAGIKPTKEPGAKVSLDLVALGLAKPKEAIKRRI